MDTHLRTFIAVELSETFRVCLAGLQKELQKTDANVKWVRPENIHITLKFLGSIPPKKVKAIKEFFHEIFDSTPAFNVRLAGLGAFPHLHKPKVIWAGLDDPDSRLKLLAERTEEFLCRLGFPKERKEFKSHITLGRPRSFKNLSELTAALQKTAIPPNMEQRIEKITFFKSTLTPQGPIYESLLTHTLKPVPQ